ncbi:MAG TPA: PhzF family phenazine biosynthesis protein [Steroidobacteraceae bacterium]|jgi:trans-2,3-dihydro-3-hydroxyanthranilate isomerase|nr:PhzF family phenazine biosynthesis protein [Steroidobacteraceae bacterium]
MAHYRYRIVNVFSQGDSPFTGNPLCVFESGDSLDTARMQALALQFNLSETTFILPSQRATARVRIFTPRYELPFAGHPTLGTAHVCRALKLSADTLTLEMPAGVIPVQAVGCRWTLQANTPSWREVQEPPGALAIMLGLDEHEILERPLWVDTGTEQLIVPLATEAAVRRATLRADAVTRLQNKSGAAMAYVFACAGAHVLARFFFQQGSAVLEDPATGSATANFGGWCLATGRPLPCTFEISQGECVGRASTLYLDVNAERSIQVSGDVLELGAGVISL